MKLKNKSKDLGLWTLVAIAVGGGIGPGVITVTGVAIAEAGRATWIAFLVACIEGLLVVFPILFYSSIAKFRGGMYTIVGSLMGDLWGGIFSVCYIPMLLMTSSVGTALGMYTNALFPFIPIKWAGFMLVTLFFVINLFGVNIMAKAQNAMTVLLLFCLLLFAFVGMGKLQPDSFNITSPDYFMGGAEGFFSGVILLVSCTSGYTLVCSFSYNAKDAKRNIPKTLLISALIIAVIYVSVSLVASNVLPVEDVAGKTLTSVAQVIFSKPIFFLFMIGGPIMALTTSLNSGFPGLAAPVLGGIHDGWLPKPLGKANKFGAPWIVYTLMYIIGSLPMLFNFTLKVITNNVVFINYIAKILIVLAAFNLPRRFKEQWEASPYHIPNWLYYTLMTFSLITQIGVIILTSDAMPLPLLLGNIIVLVVLILYVVYRHRSHKAKMSISYEFN